MFKNRYKFVIFVVGICAILCFTVSIPTYILGPNKEEHAHLYPKDVSEFCPNIHYLGNLIFMVIVFLVII